MASGTYKCPGDFVNGYVCIRGTLYDEDIAIGSRTAKGPCGKCAGTEKVAPQKIQMPNVPMPNVAEPAMRQITNNIMGHVREPINAKHEEHIAKMRDIALEFYVALHDAGGTDPNQDRFANRNLAIAATDIEVALMHAVKGVCARK